MKFRMDETLRFWVDCSYEDKRHENPDRTRAELIAEILREYEQCGDAMRYLNANGEIAWKANQLPSGPTEPPRQGPSALFQAGTEARSRSGAKCLGTLPG
jgi:hypothetical protein